MQSIDEETKKTVLSASHEAETKRLHKLNNMADFETEAKTAQRTSKNKERVRRARSEPKSSSSASRWPQQDEEGGKEK